MSNFYSKKQKYKSNSSQIKLLDALLGKKPKKPPIVHPTTKIIPKYTYTKTDTTEELKVLLDGYYLISSANTQEHYMVKAARAKKQRGIIAVILRLSESKPSIPAIITLCRISPKQLDKDDNLRHAFKNIKDGITDWLGLRNDNDERLIWRYEQQSGAAKYYAIRITISMLKA